LALHTTQLYTPSLHDALPISPIAMLKVAPRPAGSEAQLAPVEHHGPLAVLAQADRCSPIDRHVPQDVTVTHRGVEGRPRVHLAQDRKSTRLNSSHEWSSYAVF